MTDTRFDKLSASLAGTTSRRQALRLLGGGLAAGALGTVGLSQVATAQRPPAGALDVGAVTEDGLTTGVFTITNFVNQGSELLAVGTVTIGSLVDAAASAFVVDIPRAECEVLDLVLGPLNLELLGLEIFLDTVTLNITAVPGSGKLLGNLLCAVANLLNGGGPFGAIAGLLNRILGLLG